MSWIPLSLLWFGITETQKYSIVFMGCFAPAMVYVIEATPNVDPLLVRAAQNLGASNVQVAFQGPEGKVTVKGTAPTQAAKEKITLCCGNVASVTSVENLMEVTNPEPEAQYHDVVRGDTLSAIAKKFYGDANKYPVIFEANKPMLSHPDKIYPGQKLRIPPLAK